MKKLKALSEMIYYRFSWILAFFWLASLTLLFAQDPDEQIATPQNEDTLSIKPLDSIKNTSRFLALEKGGKVKRIRFYEGEKLYFRLKDDPYRYKPVIQKIGEDYIIVNNTPLNLSEIASITLNPERRLIRLLSKFLVVAGVGYLILDMANQSFNISPRTIKTSALLAGPGLALSLTLKPRKIHLNNKHYLKTILKFE